MSERVANRLEKRDFGGMSNNLDPMDQQPGNAVIQVNIQSVIPGTLLVRRGYRVVTFQN